MHKPGNWQANAFNTSPHSDNQIHSDEMARAYGFRGGLVPGVVVSSYLIHPAVEAWGLDWLARGHAKVVVHRPTYDGIDFNVELNAVSNASYLATLSDPTGTTNATAEISLPATTPHPRDMRGDPVFVPGHQPVQATPEAMQQLQEKGMSALEITWDNRNSMASYLKDSRKMPAMHQFEDGGGYANASFMLALTNWVLAGNVAMNPWIHLQTESRNYAPVTYGTRLRVECDICDLFARGGHEFVDLNVSVYELDAAKPVMTALLRAIYKMRTGPRRRA